LILLNPVIIIPVHNEILTDDEMISFRQCISILSNHDICIVCSESLDVSNYLKIYDKIKIARFHISFFSSVKGYNKLKKSRLFYNYFLTYDYLLTYELDSFVFRDELLYWCNKKYDYLGAPFHEGENNPILGASIVGVGNSGFSLRHIFNCHEILSKLEPYFNLFRIYYFCRFHYIIPEKFWIKLLFGKCSKDMINKFSILIQYSFVNEDLYWSQIIPIYFKFNISSVQDATKFSFETLPEQLFRNNQSILPFGCHAWRRYNQYNFWDKFIN
jgi:hypothetical protein